MKAIEMKCPLCGEWIHYGSTNTGRVTAKRALLKKFSQNPEKTLWALQEHIRINHPDKLLEWFPFTEDRRCPICGKQFSTKMVKKLAQYTYTKHLVTIHKDAINEKLQAEGAKPLVAEQLEMREIELPEPDKFYHANQSPQRPTAPAPSPAPVIQPIPTTVSSEGGGENAAPPPSPLVVPPINPAPVPPVTEKPVPVQTVQPVAPKPMPEEGDQPVNEPTETVQPQTPETTVPEGFKQELIFDFLKRRVEPFHGGRHPKKEPEAPAKKAKSHKGFNWGMLLPIAAVGGIFLLLWRKKLSKSNTATLLPQGAPQGQNMAPQEASTPLAAPTQELPQAPQRQRGAYFDESGRFHSSKYPDQKII